MTFQIVSEDSSYFDTRLWINFFTSLILFGWGLYLYENKKLRPIKEENRKLLSNLEVKKEWFSAEKQNVVRNLNHVVQNLRFIKRHSQAISYLNESILDRLSMEYNAAILQDGLEKKEGRSVSKFIETTFEGFLPIRFEKKTDLREVLKEVKELFLEQGEEEREVIINTRIKPHQYIEIDFLVLKVFLINLLQKILNQCPKKVKIKVHVEKNEEFGGYKIVIQDNGWGIDEDEIDNFYDKRDITLPLQGLPLPNWGKFEQYAVKLNGNLTRVREEYKGQRVEVFIPCRGVKSGHPSNIVTLRPK